AQGQRGDGLRRRRADRGFRLDPNRQPGDAAVRHGVDGAHAQAPVRLAAGIDRAHAAKGRVFYLESRANGTSRSPAIAMPASIAQASLTQSASEAFSINGLT